MEKLLNILVLLFVSTVTNAQIVDFSFDQHTVCNVSFSVNTVENTISQLLTEINRAYFTKSSLKLSKIKMEEEAKMKLCMYWSNMRFSCREQLENQKCLKDVQGYQVRDIPVTLHPIDSTFHGNIERSIVICLNKDGLISGVHTALNDQVYDCIVEIDDNVIGGTQRLEIIKFMEVLKSCYNQKDLNTLGSIFNDDAVIITGSIIKTNKRNDDIIADNRITDHSRTRNETINMLKRAAYDNKNIFVDVDFDDIKIEKKVINGKERYGVTFKQKLQFDNYNDEGSIFLILEIPEDGKPPVIHAQSWKPLKDGEDMDKENVLDKNDFPIP